MMTTTQEQIEWLEGEKPFFDKKVQDMYSDIQRKLRAAEEMAEALLFYADFDNNTDDSEYIMPETEEDKLNGWRTNDCGETAREALAAWNNIDGND